MLARRSCLGGLSRPQRLVLTLRAGVGVGAPRSRGTVARRLRITVRRVTKLEHAGLKRLRTACGAVAPAPATTTDSAAPPPPGATLAQAPAGSEPPKPRTPSRTATPAPSIESEGPAQGAVAGRSATNLPTPGQVGLDLWIPLFLLACGIGGFFAARLLPGRPAKDAPAPGANWSTPPAGGTGEPASPPAADPARPPPVADPAPPPPAVDAPPELPQRRTPSPRR